MNSQDTSSQIQQIEAAIEKLVAKPVVPGDGTANALAAQMLHKENLQKDLMQQVKLNQDQMIKDQMEQARLRSELAYKEQVQQARVHQEQIQRDREAQAKLRQEQIQRYEQQQTKLKQEQVQRDKLEQTKRRQEQMQREREQQARMKQEQMQRERELHARLKQEQVQREKARQDQKDQIQKDRAQQEKARLEQIQKDQRDLILAQRLKEEHNRIEQLKNRNQSKDAGSDKKPGKIDAKLPKTPEQLAKDEEARAFSARTEMSLTSIAFCSPLMLFGMGAAMSIFDNFAGGKKNPALLEARRKSQQQTELSEYARAEADKKFNEMVERNNLTNRSSVIDVNATKFAQTLKGTERKEDKPRVNRFVAAESQSIPVVRKNDSLEVKKLWKERQRLLEHLERVRGQGSLALVSKLVSQLETLDRSLKRLGCDPLA